MCRLLDTLIVHTHMWARHQLHSSAIHEAYGFEAGLAHNRGVWYRGGRLAQVGTSWERNTNMAMPYRVEPVRMCMVTSRVNLWCGQTEQKGNLSRARPDFRRRIQHGDTGNQTGDRGMYF